MWSPESRSFLDGIKIAGSSTLSNPKWLNPANLEVGTVPLVKAAALIDLILSEESNPST